MAPETQITHDWKTRAGYEQLFNAHYSLMVAYAYNFLKEQEASEEVCQEVFFQLWINRDKTEIKTAISSYLYRAVRNRCINLIKHITIRETYKQYNSEQIEKSDNDFTDTLTVSELDQKIRSAIDQMPLQRKKIFIMSRYEEMTYKEIAEKMGLSKKTIENQMGKALQYLREELKDYLPLLLIFFHQIINGK
ncbi:RNA polymerase sigma-70 factor [Carboxylicivirga mesophila]|uniref:RNA polymerase sigma-70 factor n=1 Tax=Carboxylicivirga mesophila TaxID=1166478 RepID=A0ABS5KCD5_9BACT|nr:RNA polymerase sigma-70 factor [Carboxylicivirga mesophila]MBS2212497.1 RNA polymerase sigma-70 factor [Carboxylicivirga mesophila]